MRFLRYGRVRCELFLGSAPAGWSQQSFGGHGEGETPGSIPNPEVKPFSADGTARGTGWESRTPPDIFPLRAVTFTGNGPQRCFVLRGFWRCALPGLVARRPLPAVTADAGG